MSLTRSPSNLTIRPWNWNGPPIPQIRVTRIERVNEKKHVDNGCKIEYTVNGASLRSWIYVGFCGHMCFKIAPVVGEECCICMPTSRPCKACASG